MAKSSVKELFNKAVNAGKSRDYKTSIKILEDLVAGGFAEVEPNPMSPSGDKIPEIYLYLSRAWNAEKQPVRAIAFGKAYVYRCPDDPAGWFFLGRAYLAKEDYSKAAAAFEKSLRIRPNQIEAMAMLGTSFLKGKQAKLARETFEEALKLSPKDERLNNGYLNALFVDSVYNYKDGNFELARQMLTFAINNGIDGVLPRLYLGHILRSMNAIPEALSQYKAAIMFEPDDKALQWYPASMMLEMGDVQGAIDILANIGLQIDGNNLSEQFLAMGVVRQHIEKGDWVRAVVGGRMYVKTFGPSVEIHLLIAEAQKNLNHIDLALNHCERALELEPNNPYIYYSVFEILKENYRWDSLQKAIVNAESKNCCDPQDLYYYKVITAAHIDNPPEEVLPHLQSMVQTENYVSDPLVYNAMGICYIKLDMPDLALSWYKKTLESYENDEEAIIGLIACYEALRFDEDLHEIYKTYLEKWANNVQIRADFAEFLKDKGVWNELSAQLEMLASQTKKNFDLDIAFALRKSGEYRKAAIVYRKLLRQKPEEKILLHNLVFCLDKMGHVKPALELLKTARKVFGEHTDSMIIESILLLRTKKTEDAIRLLQYVVDKEPNNKFATEYLSKAMNK